MSGLTLAQPAGATTSSNAAAPSTIKPNCDKSGHPPNVKCGSHYQIYGSIGKYPTGQACDKTGMAVVKTNMYGRGDDYNRHYYTWACNQIGKGPSADRWTLVVYWTQ